MYSVSGLRRGLGLLAALLLPLQSAMAQDVATVGAQDSERWFGDARAAIDKGDLPGAVSALERILLTNPDLANIKLELGLLYLRLGHADLARAYLNAALSSPEAPEAARVRARDALRQADRQLRRWSYSGLIQMGGRYQTNPNGSPGEVSLVGPGGVPVIIDGDRLSISRESDFSLFASASGEIAYGLGDQRNTALVASLAASSNAYAEQHEITSLYAGGQFGPRFLLGSGAAPGGFLRPYASYTYLGLGGARYFHGYGGGLTASGRLGLGLTLTGDVSYDRREYHNSFRRPAAIDQTGDYWTASASLFWQAQPRTAIQMSLLGERASARQDFWSRKTYGGSIGVIQAFRAPGSSRSIIGRLNASYRRSDYEDPDPLVNLTRARNEDRYEIEAGLDIPFADNLTLDLRAQQTWNPANLPNYDYKNTLGSLGISFRF